MFGHSTLLIIFGMTVINALSAFVAFKAGYYNGANLGYKHGFKDGVNEAVKTAKQL